ncbi:MAG: PfkB family carbohydrate kinase [Pelolinea sp.]|nr:PfkB family carbohydrate kinase [Pelolinea sp.]
MQFDITTLGVILIDMFPSEIGKSFSKISSFIPTPGGAPANVAVAASKLGGKTAFIGKVGDDHFGHWLADVLDKNNVNVSGLKFSKEVPTTVVFIAQPDPNSYDFIFYRNPGADTLLTQNDLNIDLLKNSNSFHFDSLSLQHELYEIATHRAIEIAKEAGALISYDFNYRPTLWSSKEEACKKALETCKLVNLVKINEIELEIITNTSDFEVGSQKILEYGPEICVVTLGEKGSYICTKNYSEFFPVFNVKTVDASGCGDAFIASLLLYLSKKKNWRENLTPTYLKNCMIFATAVGALTALNRGVISALPSLNQVENFLKTKGVNLSWGQ